ncbi:MAG: ribonuclease III [Pontixanthobacter sp.]
MIKPLPPLDPVTRQWLVDTGFTVEQPLIWQEALTHGSTGEAKEYQRLEFLGDRVLGLTIAAWLYRELTGAEGALAQRLNALVSKHSCAQIARAIDVPSHVRLGKQARDDGAAVSENVMGDIMESLIGASFVETGFDATARLIERLWSGQLSGAVGKAKHPKSALQEWAAGNRRQAPAYAIIDRSGPDHASTFTVRVSIGNVGEAQATASSKQEAETAAAKAFMERYG